MDEKKRKEIIKKTGQTMIRDTKTVLEEMQQGLVVAQQHVTEGLGMIEGRKMADLPKTVIATALEMRRLAERFEWGVQSESKMEGFTQMDLQKMNLPLIATAEGLGTPDTASEDTRSQLPFHKIHNTISDRVSEIAQELEEGIKSREAKNYTAGRKSYMKSVASLCELTDTIKKNKWNTTSIF